MESTNARNVQYSAQSNLWDAKGTNYDIHVFRKLRLPQNWHAKHNKENGQKMNTIPMNTAIE